MQGAVGSTAAVGFVLQHSGTEITPQQLWGLPSSIQALKLCPSAPQPVALRLQAVIIKQGLSLSKLNIYSKNIPNLCSKAQFLKMLHLSKGEAKEKTNSCLEIIPFIPFCLNVLVKVLPFHNRSKKAKVRDFYLLDFGLFWFVRLFSERTSSWAHSDVLTAIKLNTTARPQLVSFDCQPGRGGIVSKFPNAPVFSREISSEQAHFHRTFL